MWQEAAKLDHALAGILHSIFHVLQRWPTATFPCRPRMQTTAIGTTCLRAGGAAPAGGAPARSRWS